MCPSLGTGVFSELEPLDLQSLSEHKTASSFKKGQTLFVEDSPSAGLHCISSGSIKLSKAGVRGVDTILKIAQTGDVLGYRGILSGENHKTTATAMVDSVVCFFDRECIVETLRKQPSVAIRLIGRLGRDLDSAEERIDSMAQRNAFERTAELLLLLKNSHGKKNGSDQWVIDLRLKREELASMAGVSMVTLIRTLSELKSEKVIGEADKTISIIDETRLIQLANLE
jgi:CRP-like cAMP-binding protein